MGQPGIRSRKRAHGQPCPYCGRTMQRGHPKLNPTRDHYLPQSQGGTGADILIACIQCNGIKGDMMPAQWTAYMAAFPGWWKLDGAALRRSRWTVKTPGIGHAEAVSKGEIPPKPRNQFRPRANRPLVVPPEFIWKRGDLIVATRAADDLLRAVGAAFPATASPACALAAPEAIDAPSGSVSAPTPHSGDLL